MAEKGILERATFAAGDTIFKEGDAGDKAYVVQSGAVEIVKNIDGKDIVLGTIDQGGIFGEMALIDDQPRMASALAREGTTLIVVSRTLFTAKLAKTDPFIRGLLNIFAENIRNMSNKAGA